MISKTPKAKTKGATLQLYLKGSRELPQLFCVHGGTGLAADTLIGHLDGLAQDFDLVFYDQRGCGKSEAALDGSYTFSELATDLKEVVEFAKAEPNRPRGVFGHSLGGMVAIKALAEFPELFDFAIISNSAIDEGWRKAAGTALENLTDRTAVEEANSKFEKDPTNDSFMRDLAIEYGPIYFPELTVSDAKSQMSRFTYRAAAVPFMSSKVFPGMNLSREAASIVCPVLVISGGKDEVVPPVCQLELFELLKRGDIVTVKDGGHFPFITQKEKFSNLVTQWWVKTKEEL